MPVRMPSSLRSALDAYIAKHPNSSPSRSEVIRKILKDRLVQEGLIPPSPDPGAPGPTKAEQIEAQQEKIDALPSADPEPSPEAAMNVMRRAVAENELKELNRVRRKTRKPGR